MIGKTRKLMCTSAAVALWAAGASLARAQVASFDIPSEPMSAALNAYAETASRQIVFSSEALGDLRAPPLKGDYTADEALQRLL
ncbi:MAG: STN domain-containing protein, partial [Acetobacteraceae bacterium]|nr:STN domain-containing protein [Acetobacteraceae bacterium]